MNKKQEEFLLYCLSVALSTENPRKRKEAQDFITAKFKELGDVE